MVRTCGRLNCYQNPSLTAGHLEHAKWTSQNAVVSAASKQACMTHSATPEKAVPGAVRVFSSEPFVSVLHSLGLHDFEAYSGGLHNDAQRPTVSMLISILFQSRLEANFMYSTLLQKMNVSEIKNRQRKCDIVPAPKRFGAGFVWFAQSMSSIFVGSCPARA